MDGRRKGLGLSLKCSVHIKNKRHGGNTHDTGGYARESSGGKTINKIRQSGMRGKLIFHYSFAKWKWPVVVTEFGTYVKLPGSQLACEVMPFITI